MNYKPLFYLIILIMNPRARIDFNYFARKYSGLNGIEMLCQVDTTSIGDAKVLLENACARERQGSTFNSLPTKLRILRAVLECIPEDDAITFARMLLGIRNTSEPFDWGSIYSQFNRTLEKHQII